ncbi:MAG: hypothetical protein M3N30_07240 [Bacteroidota bacterium]|nr:hypothetical protein [Bacteroidota bacterium]
MSPQQQLLLIYFFNQVQEKSEQDLPNYITVHFDSWTTQLHDALNYLYSKDFIEPIDNKYKISDIGKSYINELVKNSSGKYPKILQRYINSVEGDIFVKEEYINTKAEEDEFRNKYSDKLDKVVDKWPKEENEKQSEPQPIIHVEKGFVNYKSEVKDSQQSASDSSFQKMNTKAPAKAPIINKIIIAVAVGLAVLLIGHYVFHIG